jgi:hypothetical protein
MVEHLGPSESAVSETNLRQTRELRLADFVIASSVWETIESDDQQLYTDIEINKTETEQLAELYELIQAKYWFMQPEYLNMFPHQQWDIEVGNHVTPIYNYSSRVHIDPLNARRIAHSVARFSASFPDMHEPLNAITVVDHLPETVFGNSTDFPMHAETQVYAGMIALSPLAFKDEDYRPDLPVLALEAVMIHEQAHFLLDRTLEVEWEAAGFTWEYDKTDNYELYLPSESNECVTEYGRVGGVYEDIAESVTAYLSHQGKLNITKQNIIAMRDSMLRLPEFDVSKANEIKLPQLPRELHYYLDHNRVDTRD